MELKNIFIICAVAIVVFIVGFSVARVTAGGVPQAATSSTASSTTANLATNTPSTGTQAAVGGTTGGQSAKLALINFEYTLTPNKIVKGVPVTIDVDASTLSGCMTTVVIKDFGVKKRITSSDHIITFTPDKAGTFWITCGMGMGAGSFEVVNPDGTSDPAAQVQASSRPSAGGSCGAGGGGCGCGGRY